MSNTGSSSEFLEEVLRGRGGRASAKIGERKEGGERERETHTHTFFFGTNFCWPIGRKRRALRLRWSVLRSGRRSLLTWMTSYQVCV